MATPTFTLAQVLVASKRTDVNRKWLRGKLRAKHLHVATPTHTHNSAWSFTARKNDVAFTTLLDTLKIDAAGADAVRKALGVATSSRKVTPSATTDATSADAQGDAS